MNMPIKIGSLNLCLGLQNKKELVKQLIVENEIDVLCVQETELIANLDHDLMSFKNFNYESEINDVISRVGLLINSGLDYTRRRDLEGTNNHVIIIDIMSTKTTRIINIYRPFNPRSGIHPRQFFISQLNLIKHAMTPNTVLMGDLNLDWSKKDSGQYAFRQYFSDFEEALGGSNLTQMVDFVTWTRTVNGVIKESTLDHLYSNQPLMLSNLHPVEPLFGDHRMVVATLYSTKPEPTFTFRRDWRGYDKNILCEKLSNVNWQTDTGDVQSCWNNIENNILEVIDNLIPICSFNNNVITKQSLPPWMKNKINLRKRLLNAYKVWKNPLTRTRLNILNKEIKSYYKNLTSSKVRKSVVPGNTSSLWKAVKVARDQNTNTLPKNLLMDNNEIGPDQLADKFALFFDNKIRSLLSQVKIEESVYNGSRKIEADNCMFMDPVSVKECIKSLKSKNTEGFDRIPQKILLDGVEQLVQPMSVLFNLIYNEKTVPDQWLIAKTIPVFKNKGDIKHVENYRPIANLCSTSKVFEKLILKRILFLQDLHRVDLTGSKQHGFKKNHSTSTLSANLQSLIARALEEDEMVLLASLDLSAAFDLVNIDLLIKRLEIVGLPQDVIELITVWLKNRSFYVCIDNQVSTMYDLLLGTVQGSILGPILYAIFVSPLFDICELSSFADDIYIPRCGGDVVILTNDMEKEIEAITKWLKKSGLKVNDEKTDICLFSKNNHAPLSLKLNNVNIVTKQQINVLGVIFDSKLNWSSHVESCIKKANKALNAIKIIRKFFRTNELINIVTSNFYSILFYNSEIWHLPTLDRNLRHSLFTASANALKICHHYPNELISYYNYHKMSDRATPEMMCNYKLALSLYKTMNNQFPETEWTHLNFNQILTSRQSMFATKRADKSRVGINCLTNRFVHLNNKIPLEWFNKTFNNYKIACKSKFLKFI